MKCIPDKSDALLPFQNIHMLLDLVLPDAQFLSKVGGASMELHVVRSAPTVCLDEKQDALLLGSQLFIF